MKDNQLFNETNESKKREFWYQEMIFVLPYNDLYNWTELQSYQVNMIKNRLKNDS